MSQTSSFVLWVLRTILVLRLLCRNADGLFWAGDTAQTISEGSSFRFNDLKSFMFRIEVSSTWSVDILWLIRSFYAAKKYCIAKVLIRPSGTQVVSTRHQLSLSRGYCILCALGCRVNYCILAVRNRHLTERRRCGRRVETGIFPWRGLWHCSIWTVSVWIWVGVSIKTGPGWCWHPLRGDYIEFGAEQGLRTASVSYPALNTS